MSPTPVVFFAFRRPELTARVFERIRHARPRILWISCDAAAKPADRENVERTRAVCRNVDWPCELHLDMHEHNLGAHQNIYRTLCRVYEVYEQAIMLEDDTLPDPSFFPYCEELLDRYRQARQVYKIDGTRTAQNANGVEHSYTFTQVSNSWGWATWRDRWQSTTRLVKIDFSRPRPWLAWARNWKFRRRARPVFSRLGALWLLRRISPLRQRFPLSLDEELRERARSCGKFLFAGMLAAEWRSMASYDFALRHSIITQNRLVVTPTRNMIENIGFGVGAAHWTDSSHPAAGRLAEPMPLPLRHPDAVGLDTRYHKKCAKAMDRMMRRPRRNGRQKNASS